MCTEPGEDGLGQTGSRESASHRRPALWSPSYLSSHARGHSYDTVCSVRVETACVSTGDWLNDLGVITVHPCDVFYTVIRQEQGSSLCSDMKLSSRGWSEKQPRGRTVRMACYYLSTLHRAKLC